MEATIDQSIRLRPRHTCEQEHVSQKHVSLSNAILHLTTCARTKHMRMHVGRLVVQWVEIGQYAMDQSIEKLKCKGQPHTCWSHRHLRVPLAAMLNQPMTKEHSLRSKVVDITAGREKLNGLRKNPMRAMHILLTYGPIIQESNQGHSGERGALYALANHATQRFRFQPITNNLEKKDGHGIIIQ